MDILNHVAVRFDVERGFHANPDLFVFMYVRKEAGLSKQKREPRAHCRISLQLKPSCSDLKALRM